MNDHIFSFIIQLMGHNLFWWMFHFFNQIGCWESLIKFHKAQYFWGANEIFWITVSIKLNKIPIISLFTIISSIGLKYGHFINGPKDFMVCCIPFDGKKWITPLSNQVSANTQLEKWIDWYVYFCLFGFFHFTMYWPCPWALIAQDKVNSPETVSIFGEVMWTFSLR